MENKSHALKAGVFTIALLIATVLAALWLNRDRIERVPYEMATTLPLQGLNPQAAVRYRGLDVGRVDEILFDPNEIGQILVRISVRSDTPVTESTYGTLNYQGVTGIAYIQLDDDGSRPRPLPTSAQDMARIPLRPSLLDSLQGRGMEILIQTQELARQMNELFAPENRKRMLAAFDNVSRAADKFDNTQERLAPTIERLPALADQAEKTLASVSMLSKVAEERAATVAGSLEHDTVPRINRLANEARTSLQTLNKTLEQFNRNPQGVLFGNPAPAPGPGEQGFVPPTAK